MNFWALTGFVNFATNALLAFFVYFQNRKNPLNVVFALFCLSIVVWSFPYALWQLAENRTSALFWARALMVGTISMPIASLVGCAA